MIVKNIFLFIWLCLCQSVFCLSVHTQLHKNQKTNFHIIWKLVIYIEIYEQTPILVKIWQILVKIWQVLVKIWQK